MDCPNCTGQMWEECSVSVSVTLDGAHERSEPSVNHGPTGVAFVCEWCSHRVVFELGNDS
jgi:hypothetical protein